jgi:hypothetical protein
MTDNIILFENTIGFDTNVNTWYRPGLPGLSRTYLDYESN